MKHLVECHQKNCWSVDLFSDGTIHVLSYYVKRANVLHILPPTMPLDRLSVPKYVYKMYIEAIDLHCFLNSQKEI